MEKLLNFLRPILPYLALVEVGLRNYDANTTGADDKAADGIRDLSKQLTDFVNNNTTTSNVAKGLKAITAFGSSVISALELLADDSAPQSERLAEARTLAASLSDPLKVYQAERGADAEALHNFKIKAEQLVLEIQNQA